MRCVSKERPLRTILLRLVVRRLSRFDSGDILLRSLVNGIQESAQPPGPAVERPSCLAELILPREADRADCGAFAEILPVHDCGDLLTCLGIDHLHFDADLTD